jgi:heme A synthase
MIENQTTRVWVNRVLAFLLGALLIYAVMSFSVVKNLKEENTL